MSNLVKNQKETIDALDKLEKILQSKLESNYSNIVILIFIKMITP